MEVTMNSIKKNEGRLLCYVIVSMIVASDCTAPTEQ